MSEEPTSIRMSAGNIIGVLGLLGVCSSSYVALNARVTALETTAANARLATLPVDIQRIDNTTAENARALNDIRQLLQERRK